MACSTASLLSLVSSSSHHLLDAKSPRRQPATAASPQCVGLPKIRSPKTTTCRKIARNVMAMATGEAPAAEVAVPEIVKTIQQTWERVEDKYAVSSVAVAGAVALWGSAGMISAIDRLPLIPGVMEVVGIGYTGWFAYKNLLFKPDRVALVQKLKDTYKEIIGGS